MSERSEGRFGRLFARRPSFPTEKDWERSRLLEPRLVGRGPELISDGGGLPFAPSELSQPFHPLDPTDPAVEALVTQLSRQKGAKGAPPKPATSGPPSLDGWRVLARTDDEILIARGVPPQLVTVAVRADARRRTWSCVAVSAARPLRATRDGIRASRWRLDPACDPDPDPEETVLRVLVTEQTWAGGKRADSRLLAPDLHVGADELVLRMYVTPREGFQVRSPNPETPARISLGAPVGSRRLIDGAVYDTEPVDGRPGGGPDGDS